MEKLRIVPAYGRSYDLHLRLRETDKRELSASAPEMTFEEIIEEAVQVSHMAWAGWRKGHVQMLFGVADVYGDRSVGSIWLLCSDDIYNYRKHFMQLARHYVEVMHRFYPVLGNFVDDRNLTSQAWLRRLGFTAGPKAEFSGHPFTFYGSDRNV